MPDACLTPLVQRRSTRRPSGAGTVLALVRVPLGLVRWIASSSLHTNAREESGARFTSLSTFQYRDMIEFY